jgi:hypothetical protein
MHYCFYRNEEERKNLENYCCDKFSKEIEISFIFIKGKITPKIYKDLNFNEHIIIPDFTIIEDTAYKIIDKLITKLFPKKINIYVQKGNFCLNETLNTNVKMLLESLYRSEKRSVIERIKKRENTIKKSGKGRTKKTKSMFDKHKKIIFKLYEQESSLKFILKTIKEKDEKVKNATIQGLSSYIRKIKKLENKDNNGNF